MAMNRQSNIVLDITLGIEMSVYKMEQFEMM